MLEELHLREVGVQRLGGGRDRADGGVAGVLGGAPRLFGDLPKGFPILPAPFQFVAVALACFSSLLGQHAELLGFGAGHFRFYAALLDAVAGRVAVLALALGCIAPAFRLRVIVLVGRLRHRLFSRLSSGCRTHHVGTRYPRALHGLDCGAGARWCAPPGHSSLPTMTGRPADVCAVVHRTGGIGDLCDLGHRALPQPYIVSHSRIRSEEGPKMKFSPDRVADPAAIHGFRGTPLVVRIRQTPSGRDHLPNS